MKHSDGNEQMAQTIKQNHGRAAWLLCWENQDSALSPRSLPALPVGRLPQALAPSCASFVSTECERNNVYSTWKLAFFELHSALHALAIVSFNCCLINSP